MVVFGQKAELGLFLYLAVILKDNKKVDNHNKRNHIESYQNILI